MTQTPTELHADYKAAWKQLPRRDRIELTQAAVKGQRSRSHEDAALTLWWIQRELRYGLRNTVLWIIGGVALSVMLGFVLALVFSGGERPGISEVLAWNPWLPLFLLLPIWSAFTRRPRLRVAAQLNAAVLAGETFNSPPDPEEAERLLRLARKEGWFRGTRPEE